MCSCTTTRIALTVVWKAATMDVPELLLKLAPLLPPLDPGS